MNLKKNEVIKSFNPNSPGKTGKLFGLPFDLEQSEVVIIPVPWEVTVSYGAGTAQGPEDILMASSQVDLHTNDIDYAWKLGVSMDEINIELREDNRRLRKLSESYIGALENGSDLKNQDQSLDKINASCGKMVNFVKTRSKYFLDQAKIVGVLGGDHSSPLGLIQALADRHSFGILQIDAHADLRNSYEGFTYSHASIMYNALKNKSISNLVQVGIRDYCEEEADLIKKSNGRISTYLHHDLAEARFQGESYFNQVERIIEELPEKVYISFDIDGLDPSLCPHTGTPVPGGLNFEEARYLIKKVAVSGRQIIGFDLCEVSSSSHSENDWDANVGARVLFNLINYAGVSNGGLKMNHY